MPSSVALTIGNFDGVHRGHAALIAAAREAVGVEGRVVVLSFDPHPMTILAPERTPPRLTTFAARERLLLDAGADEVVPLEPTPDLLAQTPETFVDMIVERYRPAWIVEGPDFRFGRRRAGSVQTLRTLESGRGYRTIAIDPQEATLTSLQIVRASSTTLRWLLERGRVRDAAAVLGRPYAVSGTIVPGDRRGRELGVPTANLAPNGCLLPADGIYAGHARLEDGRPFPAAISVGTKPTFGDNARVCEAHLVGFDGPLDAYGWTTDLRFECWLREQIAYERVDHLVEQLRRDIARVAELFPSVPSSLRPSVPSP